MYKLYCPDDAKLKSSINTTKRIPNVNKKRNTCDVVKVFNLSFCRIFFGLSLAKSLPYILKTILKSYGITDKNSSGDEIANVNFFTTISHKYVL